MEEIFIYWGMGKSFWPIHHLIQTLGSPKQSVCGLFNIHCTSALITKTIIQRGILIIILIVINLVIFKYLGTMKVYYLSCSVLVPPQDWGVSKQSESEVAQSCPTLFDPMDGSLPGSAVHGIFQARILEWAAISFSRGSSQPRDRTRVSHIAGRFFNVWATSEAHMHV